MVAKLRSNERKFCNHHGIPEERLFDASGIRPVDFKEIMKSDEKWAAYGVRPCRPAGHILRNRHNTCLMCNTQRVAHMLRTKKAGYLYVASGSGGKLMKLGFSQDPFNRLKIANYGGWGGHNDWRLVCYAWSSEGGRIEEQLLSEFANIRIPLEWERNWRTEITRESYKANIIGAIEKIVSLCDGDPTVVPY
jgi:hypothetical protein